MDSHAGHRRGNRDRVPIEDAAATDAEGSTLDETARARLVLPFYLYEGPQFDDGTFFAPCSRGLRGEAFVEDQYSGEFYFLRQLRQHRWRVKDPASALLFVVPLYVNAALQPFVAGTSCNGTHYQRLLDVTAAAVASTESYARHQGADHVIVCNSWKLAQKPPHQAPWSKQGQVKRPPVPPTHCPHAALASPLLPALAPPRIASGLVRPVHDKCPPHLRTVTQRLLSPRLPQRDCWPHGNTARRRDGLLALLCRVAICGQF